MFQLLGLRWAGVNAKQAIIRKGVRGLLAQQRPDGGWAQLPSLASDAYATGQALVALREAGALRATDPAYKRGIAFLLKTQLEDGSWYVKSRAIPFQPFFESGFPHGHDQWVSMAASNWATMALALDGCSRGPHPLGRVAVEGHLAAFAGDRRRRPRRSGHARSGGAAEVGAGSVERLLSMAEVRFEPPGRPGTVPILRSVRRVPDPTSRSDRGRARRPDAAARSPAPPSRSCWP